MPKSQNFSAYIKYLPAQLVTKGDDWRIVYYALNPNTLNLERVRLRVNRIRHGYKKKADAIRHLSDVCNNINAKLAGGWSPFMNGEDVRLYTKIKDVIDVFIAEKSKDLRPATIRSYSSWCNIFYDYLTTRSLNGIYCSTVNKTIATAFMDYSYMQKGISKRSYNNYVKQGRVFFEYAKEKGYSQQNPFETIKIKRADKKTRTIIDEESRQKLFDYFMGTDEIGMLLAINLIYGSLIRPAEIRQLKIGDIDFANRFINIKNTVAKTHYERKSLLSQESIDLMKKMNIDKLPKTYYILGYDVKPNEKQSPVNAYQKRFFRASKHLKLPKEMQLYSFRDTGIVDLLHSGVDTLDVMHLADHHDLSITTKYADHFDQNMAERVANKLPSIKK